MPQQVEKAYRIEPKGSVEKSENHVSCQVAAFARKENAEHSQMMTTLAVNCLSTHACPMGFGSALTGPWLLVAQEEASCPRPVQLP
jgi:hypothetical protein